MIPIEPIKYYILKGKEVITCNDVMEWANFFRVGKRIIKQTIVGEKIIGTIFTGLDLSIPFRKYESGPILFETMIFNKNGDIEDLKEQYSTYNEALKGHNKIVKELKNIDKNA